MIQQTARRSREPCPVYGCRVCGSWYVECRCLWRKLGNQRERSTSIFPVAETEHRLLEDVPGGQEDGLSVLDPGVRSLRVNRLGRDPARFPGEGDEDPATQRYPTPYHVGRPFPRVGKPTSWLSMHRSSSPLVAAIGLLMRNSQRSRLQSLAPGRMRAISNSRRGEIGTSESPPGKGDRYGRCRRGSSAPCRRDEQPYHGRVQGSGTAAQNPE